MLIKGKKVYVTGTVKDLTKEQVKALLVSHGAIWSTSITKSLDWLVIGSKPGPAKLEKATTLHIRTITADDLFPRLSTMGNVEEPRPEPVKKSPKSKKATSTGSSSRPAKRKSAGKAIEKKDAEKISQASNITAVASTKRTYMSDLLSRKIADAHGGIPIATGYTYATRKELVDVGTSIRKIVKAELDRLDGTGANASTPEFVFPTDSQLLEACRMVDRVRENGLALLDPKDALSPDALLFIVTGRIEPSDLEFLVENVLASPRGPEERYCCFLVLVCEPAATGSAITLDAISSDSSANVRELLIAMYSEDPTPPLASRVRLLFQNDKASSCRLDAFNVLVMNLENDHDIGELIGEAIHDEDDQVREAAMKIAPSFNVAVSQELATISTASDEAAMDAMLKRAKSGTAKDRDDAIERLASLHHEKIREFVIDKLSGRARLPYNMEKLLWKMILDYSADESVLAFFIDTVLKPELAVSQASGTPDRKKQNAQRKNALVLKFALRDNLPLFINALPITLVSPLLELLEKKVGENDEEPAWRPVIEKITNSRIVNLLAERADKDQISEMVSGFFSGKSDARSLALFEVFKTPFGVLDADTFQQDYDRLKALKEPVDWHPHGRPEYYQPDLVDGGARTGPSVDSYIRTLGELVHYLGPVAVKLQKRFVAEEIKKHLSENVPFPLRIDIDRYIRQLDPVENKHFLRDEVLGQLPRTMGIFFNQIGGIFPAGESEERVSKWFQFSGEAVAENIVTIEEFRDSALATLLMLHHEPGMTEKIIDLFTQQFPAPHDDLHDAVVHLAAEAWAIDSLYQWDINTAESSIENRNNLFGEMLSSWVFTTIARFSKEREVMVTPWTKLEGISFEKQHVLPALLRDGGISSTIDGFVRATSFWKWHAQKKAWHDDYEVLSLPVKGYFGRLIGMLVKEGRLSQKQSDLVKDIVLAMLDGDADGAASMVTGLYRPTREQSVLYKRARAARDGSVHHFAKVEAIKLGIDILGNLGADRVSRLLEDPEMVVRRCMTDLVGAGPAAEVEDLPRLASLFQAARDEIARASRRDSLQPFHDTLDRAWTFALDHHLDVPSLIPSLPDELKEIGFVLLARTGSSEYREFAIEMIPKLAGTTRHAALAAFLTISVDSGMVDYVDRFRSMPIPIDEKIVLIRSIHPIMLEPPRSFIVDELGKKKPLQTIKLVEVTTPQGNIRFTEPIGPGSGNDLASDHFSIIRPNAHMHAEPAIDTLAIAEDLGLDLYRKCEESGTVPDAAKELVFDLFSQFNSKQAFTLAELAQFSPPLDNKVAYFLLIQAGTIRKSGVKSAKDRNLRGAILGAAVCGGVPGWAAIDILKSIKERDEFQAFIDALEPRLAAMRVVMDKARDNRHSVPDHSLLTMLLEMLKQKSASAFLPIFFERWFEVILFMHGDMMTVQLVRKVLEHFPPAEDAADFHAKALSEMERTLAALGGDPGGVYQRAVIDSIVDILLCIPHLPPPETIEFIRSKVLADDELAKWIIRDTPTPAKHWKSLVSWGIVQELRPHLESWMETITSRIADEPDYHKSEGLEAIEWMGDFILLDRENASHILEMLLSIYESARKKPRGAATAALNKIGYFQDVKKV